MHMGKIEAAEEIQLLLPENEPAPETRGRGSMLLGIAVLIVALPYWTIRLIGGALWRDLRRAGKVARIVGDTYGEALRR